MREGAFSVDAREDATGRIHVVVRGRLDVAAARELADVLDGLPRPADVVIDATALDAIDASGIAVLLEGHERISDEGWFAVLVGDSPIRAALEAAGATDMLRIDPNLDYRI